MPILPVATMKYEILLLLIVRCYAFDQMTVTNALNVLVRLDTRLDGNVVHNYQNMASHKDPTHDNAKKPLFEYVPESAINRVTYKRLDELLKFYNNHDVNEPEIYTTIWEQAISSFLYAVIKTDVMKKAQNFLAEQGLVPMDAERFKEQLATLWFNLYSRGTAFGSSGFEALFAGEVHNGNVTHFGNWYRFYKLEKEGQINYHGWFHKNPPLDSTNMFSSKKLVQK